MMLFDWDIIGLGIGQNGFSGLWVPLLLSLLFVSFYTTREHRGGLPGFYLVLLGFLFMQISDSGSCSAILLSVLSAFSFIFIVFGFTLVFFGLFRERDSLKQPE